MTRRTFAVVLATLLVAQASVAPVAAQSEEDSPLVTVAISAAESPVDFAMGIGAKASSVTNKFRSLAGDEPDPATEAKRLRTHLNDNEAQYVTHSNKVIEEHNYSVGTGTVVYELTINGDESTESLFVVATADGENVTGYTATNQTNKTVAQSFSITEFQAEDLNEDVRAYYDEYVETGEVPKKGYYVSKGVQYTNLVGGD